MLAMSGVRIEIGDRVLLDGGDAWLRPGEKVALVGPNGTGKTTLLRTIAGDLQPASGTINRAPRLAYLRQETLPESGSADKLALEHLIEASPLAAMRHEMEQLTELMARGGPELDEAIHRYSDLQEKFSEGGGYELESTVDRIAAGVGLDEDALLTEVRSLSGGQRRRLELARLLIAGGDLYILDEPTNHLDAPAKRWVMNFLRDVPATVLVVSHDIKLLDTAIDQVLALDNAGLSSYRGTYSDFLRQRAEAEAHHAHAAKNITKETVRLEATKKIFAKANATHARKRQALQRRIDLLNERLKEHAPPVRRRQLKVKFPDIERAGDKVLEVTSLAKSYGSQPVFADIDLLLRRGDAMLLVGVNGAGKTTLLRCLAGRTAPDAGEVRLGTNVRLGYYAQEHEDITAAASVLENVRRSAPEMSDSELRAALGHFGLSGDVADQAAGTLSGGEKTKLALARLMLSRANLLLLDEPTNNLDVASVEALLTALQHYEGTLLLVSHDADFVSQLAPERALLLPQCQVVYFDERVIDLIPQK